MNSGSGFNLAAILPQLGKNLRFRTSRFAELGFKRGKPGDFASKTSRSKPLRDKRQVRKRDFLARKAVSAVQRLGSRGSKGGSERLNWGFVRSLALLPGYLREREPQKATFLPNSVGFGFQFGVWVHGSGVCGRSGSMGWMNLFGAAGR